MNPDFDPFAQSNEELSQADSEWENHIAAGVTKSIGLSKLIMTPRAKVIGDWCYQGDLGFIFAPRGLGKTWLGMYMAHGLATGSDIGPWKVSEAHNVLYIDGEMPPAIIQWRDKVLGPPTDNLSYINHEILFERTGRILNLADYSLQNAIINFCKHNRFSVLFLDNLSTLVTGIDENKGIDWEKILPWLLRLRRNHILVVFIHHAGRSGQMRGSSKREDPSAWIIALHEPRNDPEHETRGAHFVSSFTKNRNTPDHPKSIEWNFSPSELSNLSIHFSESEPLNVLIDLVNSGVSQCSIIAEDMQLSEASVSRLAKKAESKNLISIKNRKYFPPPQKPNFNASNDP